MEHFSCGTYYDRIGGNVRRIRMEKGLTQEKLAEKTELSLTVIQKVETGQSGSRLETLIRIAFALGVSLDILMDMKESDVQGRDWREEVYLLVRDKTVGEVKFAIAVADSIFRYKDEFLD
jgi:transcriptional regulator with XRE-family HTH domain